MNRPRLLDLYCGEGGASRGYHLAGFEVTGVDVACQRRYPYEFIQADAITFLQSADLAGFDAVHASPPCQRYAIGTPAPARDHHPDLLPVTRAALQETGLPWVIENVPGAPMRADLKLCGCMFGLPRLKRERWFETSWHAFDLRPPCVHPETCVSVLTKGARYETGGGSSAHIPHAEAGQLMGIDWMTQKGLGEAIPPAYTQAVGGYLLTACGRA